MRNKNVIIATVLGIFLLGINIFVVQKYRILKEHYKTQVIENSKTGQKETALWVNSQLLSIQKSEGEIFLSFLSDKILF